MKETLSLEEKAKFLDKEADQDLLNAVNKLLESEPPKTFKEIVQDFIDELNQYLEQGGNENDVVTDNLNDVFELLDCTVNHL